MNFLTNHQNMTADELNREMVTFLTNCGQTFDSNLPMTRENINWMTAVYAIDHRHVETANDLINLLAAMNKHYEGPINIHEGWGGCEADSNQDLITSKIRFDLSECWEDHNVQATLSAIELGWYDADDYDEVLIDAANRIEINANEGEGFDQDKLSLSYVADVYSVPAVVIYAFGKEAHTCHLYQECAMISDDSGKLYADLQRALSSLQGVSCDNAAICRYVRAWAKRNGCELQPYNTHLAVQAA